MTVEGIKYFKNIVRTLPGERTPTFVITQQQRMIGIPLDYSFMVVDEGDTNGLEPGLYAAVSLAVTPEDYKNFPEEARMIEYNLTLALAKIEMEFQSEEGEHHHRLKDILLGGGVLYTPVTRTPSGGIVLKVDLQ